LARPIVFIPHLFRLASVLNFSKGLFTPPLVRHLDPTSTTTATLRDGSPVVAALPAARGALDERRLVGTDASDLSALAGASAGTVGATLRTQKQKTELQTLETKTSGGAISYLKVEKPRFLFLEGPTDAAVAPVAAAAALPGGASAARATSSTDRPVAGASAPATGARSSTASAALSDGAGVSTSRGARPPVTLLVLLLLRRVLRDRRGGAPTTCVAGTPCSAAPGAPAAGCSSPSGAQPAPAPVAMQRGRLLEPGAWAGLTVRRPQSPSTRKSELSGSHQRFTRK
jgi:hypothetical protein